MRGRGGRCRWLCAGVATALAVAALGAALCWSAIFDSVLASQLALTPSSRTFREWLAPTVPLFFDVHLFNWTNADRFPEETPRVEQLGPYRFVERRRHANVSWHPHNGSLSYRTHRTWHFLPEASNGSLDDNVTSINAIAASAVYRGREWNFIRQKGLSMGLAMFGEQFSITKTAGVLMFEGYEDPLLEMAKSLPASATGGAPIVDRFGWFYGRNDTYDTDGQVDVTTGVSRGTLPGQILKWNYEDELPYYNGQCAKLSGSVGEFLPRDLTPESRLSMFISDLCRSVHMDYRGDGELDGLPYYTYELSETSFDNASISHVNTCFCNGDCGWAGVMNVSACRFGSPAFISLPHFLHADPALRTLVHGMEPDPEKHSFYFSVEPKLGVPLDVAARFQLNMYIEPQQNIALYEHVPKMLFPIFWVEQRVMIQESVRAELRFVRSILDWGAIFCAGVAIFFASVIALATCTNICIKKPLYIPTTDILYEKPKDEAELKLNPL